MQDLGVLLDSEEYFYHPCRLCTF